MPPQSMYTTVLEYLLYDKFNQSIYLRDEKEGQYFYFSPCNLSSYQSLWLRFEDMWFEVKPRTYLLERHPTQTQLCRIGFAVAPSQELVLGLVFLRNFYLIFDTD